MTKREIDKNGLWTAPLEVFDQFKTRSLIEYYGISKQMVNKIRLIRTGRKRKRGYVLPLSIESLEIEEMKQLWKAMDLYEKRIRAKIASTIKVFDSQDYTQEQLWKMIPLK